MLTINVLGSGSSGNSALVRSERTSVLIDAGLSARRLKRGLDAVGCDPEDLSAIVLTHEHGDHVRGLDVFCRQHEVPVYCNALTRESLEQSLRHSKQWRIVEAESAFVIGDLEASAFAVTHDAVDPMGFVFSDAESTLGVLSDVGHVTKSVRRALGSVDTLFVEANYDLLMLQNDTKRPWSTKQRILSRHGHLSNDQAAELVGHCAPESLQQVVLGHLSQDCNDPSLARETVEKRLESLGHSSVGVRCAGPDGLPDTLSVASAEIGRARRSEQRQRMRRLEASHGMNDPVPVLVQTELF